MRTRGVNLNVGGSPTARRSGISIELQSDGQECVYDCLNGGSWRALQRSNILPDGTGYASKTWIPRYARNESGDFEFFRCACDLQNTEVALVSVLVTVYGVPGQFYQISGSRAPAISEEDWSGEDGILPTEFYNKQSGVIPAGGVAGLGFAWPVLQAELYGELPPPTFLAEGVLGGKVPLMSAGVMPDGELFEECFFNCTRELNQVQVPVWTGCRVDNRESEVLRAISVPKPVQAYDGESLSIAMKNLPEPAMEDLVVIQINLPGTTVKIGPMKGSTGGLVGSFDFNYSVYKVESFEDGVATAGRRVTYVGPFSLIRSPNVSPADYFGRETMIVMFKNKYPGAVTDYSTPDIGQSCVMEGDGFVALAGSAGTSDVVVTAELADGITINDA